MWNYKAICKGNDGKPCELDYNQHIVGLKTLQGVKKRLANIFDNTISKRCLKGLYFYKNWFTYFHICSST